MQVKIEKARNDSINIKNKRNREKFKELISNVLNDNFYYFIQKYLFFLLIKNLFEYIFEKFGKTIYKTMKLFFSSEEANNSYHHIYLRIFNKVQEKINKFKENNEKNL